MKIASTLHDTCWPNFLVFGLNGFFISYDAPPKGLAAQQFGGAILCRTFGCHLQRSGSWWRAAFGESIVVLAVVLLGP